MSEKNKLARKEAQIEIIEHTNQTTLLNDVASEMNEKYNEVNDIIKMLMKDTRIEDIVDEDGAKIGQKTHIHPQLLSWYKEARQFQDDLWKITGGEIKQEGEKKKIEVAAKILLEGIKENPEVLRQRFEEWTKNRSFKK